MDAKTLNRPEPVVGTLVVASILITALYIGRDLLVPIALAILLSFVLAPLVRTLQRWGAPKKLAIVVVVVVAFTGLIALGASIAKQVASLAGELPTYQATIREKIEKLRNTAATSSPLERAADVLHELGRELNKPKENTSSATIPITPIGQEIKPIPVEVRQPPPTPLHSLSALISPLLGPLTTTAIIAIFVVFILFQREDLRNRFIKLAGSRDLHKTTVALDDAAERLGKLLLMQLALNTGFGVFIG